MQRGRGRTFKSSQTDRPWGDEEPSRPARSLSQLGESEKKHSIHREHRLVRGLLYQKGHLLVRSDYHTSRSRGLVSPLEGKVCESPHRDGA